MNAFNPPPEMVLIEDRRKALGKPKSSITRVAKLAGISESRWRQLAKGYQQATAKTRIPQVAPAETLARMARAVGVTDSELSEVGRPDSAAAYKELVNQNAAQHAAAERLRHHLSELEAAETKGSAAAEVAVHAYDREAAALAAQMFGNRGEVAVELLAIAGQLTDALERDSNLAEVAKEAARRLLHLTLRLSGQEMGAIRPHDSDAAVKRIRTDLNRAKAADEALQKLDQLPTNKEGERHALENAPQSDASTEASENKEDASLDDPEDGLGRGLDPRGDWGKDPDERKNLG